jgi:hypothetical protein
MGSHSPPPFFWSSSSTKQKNFAAPFHFAFLPHPQRKKKLGKKGGDVSAFFSSLFSFTQTAQTPQQQNTMHLARIFTLFILFTAICGAWFPWF